MASDAHAHPQDILHLFPGAEDQRRSIGAACAASAWNREEFFCHEKMAAAAQHDGAPLLHLCFAVHPQLPASLSKEKIIPFSGFRDKLEFLESLADQGRISAIGETGFDLYSPHYKETETIQDDLFAVHLYIACRYTLPVVLHVRRAMHKIFPHTGTLKKLPAVVFHSWSGAPQEAFSLLRRGVRAFFSFGTTLLLNHKNAILSCAELPANHILLETDAPYQPLRGKEYSSWADLPLILAEAAKIRKGKAAREGTDTAVLEEITGRNFKECFYCREIRTFHSKPTGAG